MSHIPMSQPTPSPISEWLRRLIQTTKIDATGQESAIVSLATTSLCASSVASSAVVKSSATIVSRGQLAPAPGTKSAVDSKMTVGSRALDYTNVVGTTLAPFVGAIPVIGGPLKDAIGGLLGILTIVDVSVKSLRWHPTHTGTQKMSQNKQAIKGLTFKLRELLDEINSLPEASTPRALQLQRKMIWYFIIIFTL